MKELMLTYFEFLRRLHIFPKDTLVPLTALEHLWKSCTGGRTDWGLTWEPDAEWLWFRLTRSLDAGFDLDHDKKCIRLKFGHRQQERSSYKKDLMEWNRLFLDSYKPHDWTSMDVQDMYWWDYLVYHTLEAGEANALKETILDWRYLFHKIRLRGAWAAEQDINQLLRLFPQHEDILAIKQFMSNLRPLLEQCGDAGEIATVLYERIAHVSVPQVNRDSLRTFLATTHILSIQPLPDMPHPALKRTFFGHRAEIEAIAISPNGDWLLSAGSEGVFQWDIFTGEIIRKLENSDDGIEYLTISPDGQTIFGSTFNQSTLVWSAVSGKLQNMPLQLSEKYLAHVQFFPDGKWVLFHCMDGCILISEHFQQIRQLSQIEPGRQTSVRLSPDGTIWTYVAEIWADDKPYKKEVRLHDIKAKTLINTLICSNDLEQANIAFANNGMQLIVAESNDYGGVQRLTVWQIPDGRVVSTKTGDIGEILEVFVVADSRVLITVELDKLKMWDVPTLDFLTSVPLDPNDATSPIRVEPNGNWFVTGKEELRLWDLKYFLSYPNHLDEPTIQVDYGNSRTLAISPSGNLIAIGNRLNNETTLLDFTSRETIRVFPSPRGRILTSVRFAHAHNWIILGYTWTDDEECVIQFWNLSDGTLFTSLNGFECTFDYELVEVLLSADDQTLYIVTANTITTYNTTTFEITQSFSLVRNAMGVGGILAAALMPNEQEILVGTFSSHVAVIDLRSGNIAIKWETDVAEVCDVDRSSDGKLIVSGSIGGGSTGDLHLWSASNTKLIHALGRLWPASDGNLIHTLGNQHGVVGVAFSPDGRWVASASYDKTLKIWDVVSGNCIATFHAMGVLVACAWHPSKPIVVAAGHYGLYWLEIVGLPMNGGKDHSEGSA